MILGQPLNDPTPAPGGTALDLAFETLGARKLYTRESAIYDQDDAVELLFRIVRGVVRTTRLTVNGRRQVGDFYYAGEIFGLEPGPAHRFAAEALTDCEVVIVRRASVRAVAGDAELDRAILEATRRELERVQEHVVLLGLRGARERVAGFLAAIAHRQDEPQVDLPMSRQDMADYLGLTIETVSRMLTRLQDDAIVAFPSTRRFEVRRWSELEALAA
ncbi:MAG: helix-turn-helix domain-containing protein [Phenylobacterium sp.]|jgi:CRP/FNR family nitrogen fixation transcriptional regulator